MTIMHRPERKFTLADRMKEVRSFRYPITGRNLVIQPSTDVRELAEDLYALLVKCAEKFQEVKDSDDVHEIWFHGIANEALSELKAAGIVRDGKPTDRKDREMAYKTVEGHEIVRDGVYEMRNGEKAVVLGFIPDEDGDDPIVGYYTTLGESFLSSWLESGFYADGGVETDLDIMRPWVAKKHPVIERWVPICSHYEESTNARLMQERGDGHIVSKPGVNIPVLAWRKLRISPEGIEDITPTAEGIKR